jgi:hypothetical protein
MMDTVIKDVMQTILADKEFIHRGKSAFIGQDKKSGGTLEAKKNTPAAKSQSKKRPLEHLAHIVSAPFFIACARGMRAIQKIHTAKTPLLRIALSITPFLSELKFKLNSRSLRGIFALCRIPFQRLCRNFQKRCIKIFKTIYKFWSKSVKLRGNNLTLIISSHKFLSKTYIAKIWSDGAENLRKKAHIYKYGAENFVVSAANILQANKGLRGAVFAQKKCICSLKNTNDLSYITLALCKNMFLRKSYRRTILLSATIQRAYTVNNRLAHTVFTRYSKHLLQSVLFVIAEKGLHLAHIITAIYEAIQEKRIAVCRFLGKNAKIHSRNLSRATLSSVKIHKVCLVKRVALLATPFSSELKREPINSSPYSITTPFRMPFQRLIKTYIAKIWSDGVKFHNSHLPYAKEYTR